MAICPECISEKPFFARRCHSCNEEIGLIRQTFAMYVYYTTIILSFWFVIELLALIVGANGDPLGVLLIWIMACVIPMVIMFFIFMFFIWLFSLIKGE